MDVRTEEQKIEEGLGLSRVSAGRGVDRIVRKGEAARLLGISGTSLWRLETLGLIRAVSVLPGLSGFKESELQAFIESRQRAEPNRARVSAALASPRHGRAGRAVREVA